MIPLQVKIVNGHLATYMQVEIDLVVKRNRNCCKRRRSANLSYRDDNSHRKKDNKEDNSNLNEMNERENYEN